MSEDTLQLSDQPQTKRSRWRKWIIIAIAVFAVLVIVNIMFPVLLVRFVAQPVKIEGFAMHPTLKNGDRVFIGKDVSQLNRGDMVVFWYPRDTTKSFIKRIIALPGESIEIAEDGTLYINGVATEEPYLSTEGNQAPRRLREKTIESDHYFVMGDNRDASNDSRSFGTVDRNLIYGKVLWRYWSADE